MAFKETKFYSVLTGTCPRCHQSKVFKDHRPYQSMEFDQVNPKCTQCGQSFQPEPGFYQGAMYVSYALTMVIGAVISILAHSMGAANVWAVAGILLVVILVLLPIISRVSRLVWLNIFVDFEPDAIGKK